MSLFCNENGAIFQLKALPFPSPLLLLKMPEMGNGKCGNGKEGKQTGGEGSF